MELLSTVLNAVATLSYLLCVVSKSGTTSHVAENEFSWI